MLRNNSHAAVSLTTKNLRLIPDDFHVVGTWGQWSPGEGTPLETENGSSGPIELQPGSSLRLSTTHEFPLFELLGPTRVSYRLSSSDPGTKKLLPADPSELIFDIPPTKLISSVWAAQTQTEREQTQAAFNEFLKFRAGAVKKDEAEFQKQAYASKTLFYLAGYALPFLSDAFKHKDPFIREQSVLAYPYAARAIPQLNAYLEALDALGPRPQWAATLQKDYNRDQSDWRSFALRALGDPASSVRIAAVTVLTQTHWDQYSFDASMAGIGTPKPDQQMDVRHNTARELNEVKALAKDPDAGVRAAVQTYLTSFADQNEGADTVADALTDPDPTVRQKAIDSLRHSAEPPPLETLKRAFPLTKGETAIELIRLLLEQEDSTLPTTLGVDFARRSEAERLAIMTTVAGHNDAATLQLIKSGLSDPSQTVQRTALMRLLVFPENVATPLLENVPAELRPLAAAVKKEIETRALWPFLQTATGDQSGAAESVFPSQNGRTPVTSPDGQWIAYVETGWDRPGGSGGFGRSNLISISRVVDANGRNDRVVSDMFLVGWTSDSKRVGTARDGFVALSDLDGNVVAEFGALLPAKYRVNPKAGADWTRADLRSQFGGGMPHQKRLEGTQEFGFGEGGAFSPDGRLYGPLRDRTGSFFLSVDGQRVSLKIALADRFSGAVWSPDGRYVRVDDGSQWVIIDMQTQSSENLNVDEDVFPGDGVNSRRWSQWSRNGKRLTFVRDGQVWVSDALGNGAKQLTFDNTRKAFPIFSRDGECIAYLTWQPDDRRHYTRPGPTDLWVIDLATTLTTRITTPANGRINSFDWLDDHTLIFDRLEQRDGIVPHSSLRRISLTSKN